MLQHIQEGLVYKQDCSKVFTTGQSMFNTEHYVIKYVGGR